MTQAKAKADNEKPRFILCADDFALTEGVSRGILELLAANKISATGAMTNRPHWQRLASELMGFAARADLGVHLNLTCAAPLSIMPILAGSGQFPELGTLARAALTSEAARAEIRLEINHQLDAFEQATGRAPDFVDGHQHVHALPGIRGSVIDAIKTRYKPGAVYLRDPADKISAIVRRGVAVKKALAVSALASGLARQAKAAGIPVNQGFSGFSLFDPQRGFAADMQRYLLSPGQRHLVMCHPGFADDELTGLDPVTITRNIEFRTLKNHDFKYINRFNKIF